MNPQSPHPDDVRTNPGETGLDSVAATPDGGAGSGTEVLVLERRATLRLRRCRLQVTAGPHEGRALVSDKERLRCGAHASNDLVLAEDRAVSRHHFELITTERGRLLVDLNSTNGTVLGGRRIERAYLSPGAQVRAGSSTLTFTPIDEEVSLEPDRDGELCGLVGQSQSIQQLRDDILRVADLAVPVLIRGETGTGKELVARAIHELSGRKKGPLVVLDCGAIPPHLIESELFGHEKGAFTGAVAERPGAFERAHGGTIFLDELGELRLDLQPKLLRVLENHEVRRVGGNDTLTVDCRVIAATNRDLVKEIAAGHFREDLFFRLSVIHLQLPPLRERREDIPLILSRALADPEVLARHGKKLISPEALALLMAYPWPGNVRELVNVLSHVLAFSEGEQVLPEHLPERVQGQARELPLPFNEHLTFKDAKEQLLEDFEREYVTRVLSRCEGNLSRAARESGLHRKSIERLVKKYQLDAKGMKPR